MNSSMYEDAILKALGINPEDTTLTAQVLEEIKLYAKKHGVILDVTKMTANLRKAIQNPLYINKEGKMSESKDNPEYVPIKGTAKNNEIGEQLSPDAPSADPLPPTRTLDTGTQKYTKILTIDAPEFGANHYYQITDHEDEQGRTAIFAEVLFQKGPIEEHGVNGCQNEDLIAIVIDRLGSFRETEFKYDENDRALFHLEQAFLWLQVQTNYREAKGVEGTSNE